jgi:Ca2+-transporting ATPase
MPVKPVPPQDEAALSSPAEGLGAAQAAQRLHADGPNEVAPAAPRTPWRILGEVVREPMFLLLLAAGGLYLLLGDVGEALMLLAFVALTAVITVVQEQRTERALDALRDLSNPMATVVRDGVQRRLASRELVCGDVLVLTEGERVAADARILSANDLQADESMLTGESMPVAKQAADTVYAGTMLVGGMGVSHVVATGPRTELGRIGKALASMEVPRTPLNTQIRRLVRVFSVMGLALSLLVLALYGFTRGDWLGGVLAGITLAMSMLPQEFPLILTVFMAMGAWRLSQSHVLARRAATIETLGAATVLCTDKTGTLTLNRMAIAELMAMVPEGTQTWLADQAALPAACATLVEFGMLASERDPFDPMDKAFQALGTAQLPPAAGHADWSLAHEYGLSPDLMAMTHVWQDPKAAGPYTVAVKGALEAVVSLCHMDEARQQQLTGAASEMAGRGLRVLAVARASHAREAGADWPATPRGFAFEMLGLVALADPLRPGVPAAVAECRSAGIRVVMITGDHPATAVALARQAGLDVRGPAITGAALAEMSEAQLLQCLPDASVFARVQPDQKLRIVQALKAQGEVVAMTGDGVNDAPSLKAAHIGIAMGLRGTDVAREAASLVLLDDDFGSIVRAMRMGRRIYDNLLKAMAFVLAVHVPIAGLSLLPLLLGLPQVFMPVHIAFLELLIDPACSIVLEAEADERNVMQRPPRDPGAPLFSRQMITSSLMQGVFVLVLVGAFFVGMLHLGVPQGQARAATFAALVISSVALILVNRALSGGLMASLRRPNPALWRMVLATGGLLAAVLFITPLQSLFHFEPVQPIWLAASAGLGLSVWALVAGALALVRRTQDSPMPGDVAHQRP